MLENHPLLIEKESYKVKYLNVLEYFSQKYSANDPWANQTLQLYIKKFLGTICYSLKDKSVVFWDHETNDISVVSSTLSAFLESLY